MLFESSIALLHGSAMPKKYEPAAWQKADAARLKTLFAARSPMTQEAFAMAYGFGTQGNVGHYLNGRRPLNLKAARAFADGLGVEVGDFSQHLARELESLAKYAARGLSEDEARWLDLMSRVPETLHDAVFAFCEVLIQKGSESSRRPDASIRPPGKRNGAKKRKVA